MMAEPDDNDLDWEEWMSLSEAEQERVITAEFRQLVEIRNRMTPAQLIIVERRSALRACLNWRSLIARNFCPDFAREHLKACQVRLVKLRARHPLYIKGDQPLIAHNKH